MNKVALIIGHNPKAKGAYSPYLELSEYDFWSQVCDEIHKLDDTIDIYHREYNQSYKAQMTPIINEVNNKRYDYVFELHFNSGVPNAKGTEMLIHPLSYKSKFIAELLIEHLQQYYQLTLRANQGIYKVRSVDDRGGYGIYATRDPYVLIEPFFGSNEESLQFKDTKKLAKVLVEFIHKE